MPYIPRERKAALGEGEDFANPGELNYWLTLIVIEYVEAHGLSYQTINDVMGALEGCKQEFYARVGRPYEVGKCLVNGDVYPEDWSVVRADR